MKTTTLASPIHPFVLSLLVGFTSAFLGCAPKYPACKDDSNCAEHGEVCVSGVCKQCRDNGQCKPGYECKAGGCVEKPECTKNEDCKDGLVCRNQKCVPQCTTDKDCSPTEKCEQNRCVPRPECDADHPCPAGKICQDNKCVEPPKQTEVQPEQVKPAACTLTTVHFDFNDYSLSEQARSAIDHNAECIKQQHRRVLIEGNCDERGTEEYNINLGNKRADAVRRYLENLGIATDQLRIVSYGKERPVDPGHDEAAWSANRRADFVWQ